MIEERLSNAELFHLIENVGEGRVMLAAFLPSLGHDLFGGLQEVEALRPVEVPDVGHQRFPVTVLVHKLLQRVLGATKIPCVDTE